MMTGLLICILAICPSLIYGYLGITYNLKDCTDVPPVQYCGRAARQIPPIVLYFYHATSGKCEPFLWSDCPNSHSNNVFPTKEQCQDICKDPLTVTNAGDDD